MSVTVLTLTFLKDDLHNLINNQTIYLSDPLGPKENNTSNRIADVIPLTDDDRDFFDTSIYQVSKEILVKLAYDVEDIDDPYTVDGTEVIYKFNLYSGANELIITPLVHQAVSVSFIFGIMADWLTVKGFFQQAAIYKEKYEKALMDIKSSLMYGQTASKTYRQL